MSETKSTAPETLEELRAALRRWVDGTRSYADHVERDAGAYQDAVWRIAIHRDAANQIAALLPEPIKVGQTVKRCASRDDHLSYEVVAITDGKRVHLWNEETTTPAWDWVHGVRRVDSSPSPEPEHDPDPAPSPSPEVGEGAEPHESEDPEELAAAVAAGLMVNPRPPGADWRDRQTYDRRVGTFREALDYGFRYRIWGTVPGYGETGGAS